MRLILQPIAPGGGVGEKMKRSIVVETEISLVDGRKAVSLIRAHGLSVALAVREASAPEGRAWVTITRRRAGARTERRYLARQYWAARLPAPGQMSAG
jgi:hypothetical protein